MIVKLITDDEIIMHQAFFVQCAKDYQKLATELIDELADSLKVKIDPKIPLKSFNFLKSQPYDFENMLGIWNYYVHGIHCRFENSLTNQEIEVSLVHGLDFGHLDPCFFVRYIKSTPNYIPMPIDIFNDYEDGVRILKKIGNKPSKYCTK